MSSKTPKANAKKIKWGLRVIALVLVIVVLAAAVITHITKHSNESGELSVIKCALKIEGRCVDLEVASTHAQLTQGLSGRLSMPRERGMLFDFGDTGRRCFWMKDMNFPLDMIWLNTEQKVVKIERNISPDTYPANFCADEAQYVIELNAGEAAWGNLAVGQRLSVIQ